MDNPITKGTQIKADLMMVMVTMFWGASYLFMKMGLHSIQEFNLIALRFGIAFLIAVLVFYRRLLKIDGKTISLWIFTRIAVILMHFRCRNRIKYDFSFKCRIFI